MSAGFPSVSGPYSTPSTMYPTQGGYNYNDPYSQSFANPPAASNYPPQVPPQANSQQMGKPTYDPRQANGYSYPNGGPPMMSSAMSPAPQYSQQPMRHQQPPYYGQQTMTQMQTAGMQKPPASVASSAPMGPPNGMSHMMMQQTGMGQMSASPTVPPNGQIPNQMKSPMPGNMPQMPIRPSVPQMNSPGMFTAPAPRIKQQSMPSPSAMHMMPIHSIGGDPSASSGNHMIQSSAQMNSSAQQPKSLPPPPSQETPFTAVTHYEMPAAFPQYQGEFKRHNPTTSQYYERRRTQLKINYPTGQTQPPAQEPATFGFLPGQAHYEGRFDRCNNVPSNNMSMISNPMIQRQMSAPGITSPAYGQQQLMGAPSAPTAKRNKRSASTSVEATNSPYTSQQNRMMSMGTFNNPNMKNGMNGQMGAMPPPSIPATSVSGASNGMHMMSGMGQNGMSSVMPSTSMSMGMDSISQNGLNSHMSNGMPMSSMASNGGFAAPQDLRPPPQYTQMPTSSQQAYNNQMQQRYGNGLMSPGHPQQPPTSMPQNDSHPGIPMQQQAPMHQQMFMRQPHQCHTCKGTIPPNTPAKVCANPSCHHTFHLKCVGLTDAATSMLDSNAEIGWVCPVCEPRSAR